MKVLKKTWVAAVFLLALVFTGAENQAVASVDTMATGVVITKDQNLNVRQAASSTSKIIGSVAKASTVNIYNRIDDFYKIQYKGGVGYVHVDYIKATYKVINTYAVGFINDKAKVINYRSNPETKAKALGVITTNHKVYITGIIGTWYQIKINNVFAYIPKENVGVNPIYTGISKTGTVKANNIIYQATNPSSATLYNVTKGTTLSVTGYFGDWYRVNYKGKIGYMLKSGVDLQPTFKSNNLKSYITVYRKVNLYNEPNTNSGRISKGIFIINKFDISDDGKWVRYVDYDKLFASTVKTYYLSTNEVSYKTIYGKNASGNTNLINVPKYISIDSFQTAYIRMYYEIRLIEAIEGKAIDALSEKVYKEALAKLETYTSDQLKQKLLKVRNIPVIRAAEVVYTAIDDYDSIFSSILLGVEAQLYYNIVKADKGKGITLKYTYIGTIKSSVSQ